MISQDGPCSFNEVNIKITVLIIGGRREGVVSTIVRRKESLVPLLWSLFCVTLDLEADRLDGGTSVREI